MTKNKFLVGRFRDMMRASYGPGWSASVTEPQIADMFRAFMSGAVVVQAEWTAELPEGSQESEDNLDRIQSMNIEIIEITDSMDNDNLLMREIIGSHG